MTKVKYDFNPFGSEYADTTVKGSKRQEIIDELKDYIKTRMLDDIGSGLSPVSGKKWKGLTAEYKKKKLKEAGNTSANLELFGDMLDSIEISEIKGGGLRVTVSDDQQAKADGHNNFSGKSPFAKSGRLRKFIPNESNGEKFRPNIRDGIIEIVTSMADDGDE